MIIDEIKKANIQSIKDKDTVARSIYSVILNKFMLEGIKRRETNTELADADYIQILQKTIKELSEECENYRKVNNTEEVLNIEKQIKIIQAYLPQMMSSEEIKKKIVTLLEEELLPEIKNRNIKDDEHLEVYGMDSYAFV